MMFIKLKIEYEVPVNCRPQYCSVDISRLTTQDLTDLFNRKKFANLHLLAPRCHAS